jgi:cysteine-rich repeat protein
LTWLAAAPAADHPIEADALRLRDNANPERRLARFRASADPAIDPSAAPDPRVVGATLQIVGTAPGDGSSGVISLAPPFWTALGNPPGSRGYRYLDRARTVGVRRAIFKPGRIGGRIGVSAGGVNWPYAVLQSQEQIEVHFTVGSERYCAEIGGFSFRRNEPGLVIARHAPAPHDCAIPVCGNGTIETPEECDDSNVISGDGCSDLCDIEPYCGNGRTEGTEECDDGDADSGDGCSSACELENTSAICAGIQTVAGTDLDAVLVAVGLNTPTHMTAPPLDPRRLFVAEQAGTIRVIHDGVLLPAPFLDISGKIQCAPGCGERGLLSLAFHPDYESNGRFFVDYTNTDGDTVIARYQVSGDPDVADPDSELVLRIIPQPFANHNGGQLAFGPDGYLYSGKGDGGNQGDPFENGQSDATLLGKLLRFDVDVDVPPYYAVPAGNPNAAAGDPLGLIWAKGFRNPWRFSFDRANGDLYIGDVGQDAREEIDYQPASSTGGENYGWNIFEGNRCFDPPPHFSSCTAARPFLVAPVHEYSHSSTGSPCSVTGGFVYRGCRMPDLAGTYFYADFCSDRIWTFKVVGGDAQNHVNRTADLDPVGTLNINSISSFGEDARGELYIVDRTGELFRIVPEP